MVSKTAVWKWAVKLREKLNIALKGRLGVS